MPKTADEIKNRRLEKMRLGQHACEVATLPSDPEERVALVPLTQGEYINSLQVAASIPLDDNIAGRASRDEIQRSEILAVACREVEDLTQRYYANSEAVRALEAHDLNHMFDVYLEMVAEQSPELEGLSEDDFADLKKRFRKSDGASYLASNGTRLGVFSTRSNPCYSRAIHLGLRQHQHRQRRKTSQIPRLLLGRLQPTQMRRMRKASS
jgi:hypothetical protein